MKALFSFLLAAAVIQNVPSSSASTLFDDGFEAGQLGTAWSTSVTSQGRVTVSTANVPATGSNLLILDDSVSDATYSVAEATISLDLTNKKNVVLSFKAKSLGNEAHTPPTGNFTTTRAYDGVAISTNGGTTWRSVQSLAAVGTAWESFSIMLDASVTSLAGTFGPDFRVRFSGYDNAPVPLDGIAIDDVLITGDEDQRAVLELPATLVEGSGPHTGYVLLAFPPATPLTLTLSSSPAGQLTLPANATVPAGDSFASFQFSVVEDSLVNLTRSISVSVTAAGVTASPATISITDNDVPLATLTIPAQLTEGATATNNASVSIDRVSSVALTFTLSSTPSGELTLPASVTIPIGQTQIAFTAVAVNDTKIDGDIPVTVTATTSGVAPATAQTTAVDNETRTLGLTLPTTVQEGGTASGIVTIPGTLTSALDVTLTSANESSVTVPATVTIAAGQTQATFTITGVDNAVRDGSRSVSLSVAAATFTGTSKAITVRDNEVAGYRFGTLGAMLNISNAVSTSITGLDIEGNAISGFSGVVNLSVVLPDSSTQPLTPATATLSGASGWSGSVTVPNLSASPLRLRASDANGNTGESTSFDVMRTIVQQAADLVWDSTRSVIYASIPAAATGGYANKVIVINPVTLQVTGSVTTNQDPGQLALTSGNEALYVALNANGTVAKIDLATLTISSTFAVGTDVSYGTLYAEDICTVAGQPNLLVVSQYRKSVSPRHNGVAVYDNGVRRTNKTQDHTGSNIIEPSADPTIYFGYNTESTEYGFRRLKLDANGMSQLIVNTTLLSGFSIDMRSAGDKVFSTNGVAVNGTLMTKLGSFGTSGPVRPDLASNRIYYIEPQSGSTYDKIGAYDPTTLSLIRRVSLPSTVTSPTSFIRWGTTGLAFRTSSTIYLINSSQTVPSDPPANLAVTVQATPNPATVAAPLTYTIQVTNQGPNVAKSSFLNATLSDSQTIQTVTATTGTPSTSGLAISLPVGELASGASATLTVVASPQSAGSLTCIASASSNAIDPDFTNNTGSKLVSVGFVSGIDVVNQLRLTGNNVVADATRNVLWVSIPSTVAAPLGKTILSVDPSTGLISDPIALNASPMANSMALSANGRYLYVGLSDVAEISRIDLTATPPTIVRVPLGLNGWGDAGYAADIEVLDGNGTSILATTTGDESALVIDGTVRRSTRTGIYTVNRIERTSTAGVFVGYNNAISSYPLTRLSVTASGVAITQTVNSLVTGFSTEIRSNANITLSSSGQLVDSSNLSLKSNLGVTGRPCVDAPYQRAYLVNGASLRAFDTTSGAAAGTMALPTTSTGDWAQSSIRWGADGFAILGPDKLYIARWSSAIPAGLDANSNGIADNWEATNFGALGVNPAGDIDGDGIANGIEYFLATLPTTTTSNPIQINTNSDIGQNVIHVVFPRRAGLSQSLYGYECSTDLATWNSVPNVTETVVSSQTVNGVLVETVDAQLPCPAPNSGFVRLKWIGQ
jgi:hypothetical protein